MSNVHPIFDRILSTMNGSHELTAEQRAELRDPKHADVAKQLHSPATPTQPAPTAVAGGGAGDPPFRVVGTDIWCGARVVDQLLTVSMARHICDLLNRAYWFGHETCARGMQP